MPFPFRARGRSVRRAPGVMNKTEAEYSEHLERRERAGEILGWWFEAITVKLAKDTRYTPDFVVMLPDSRLEFHEIKGFMEGDAWVKMKVTAQQFAWLADMVVIKKRAKKDGGGWKIETVGEASVEPEKPELFAE